jgi:plasmid stabilization system protein ParE
VERGTRPDAPHRRQRVGDLLGGELGVGIEHAVDASPLALALATRRVERTRELVIPPTPYIVAYTVDSAGDVIILGIVHGAQRRPQQLD